MHWDVRLLTGAYKEENGEIVVELYGKTKEGKSITLRNYGFKPYFYLVASREEIEERLKGDENLLGIGEVKLWRGEEQATCSKVILKYPWKVSGYRNKLKEDYDVLAADIPFVHRFIYDTDLGACVTVEGEEEKELVNKYTTDLVVKATNYADCRGFKPKLKILSFDLENSVEDNHIYTICCAFREKEKIKVERLIGKEEDVLKGFEKIAKEYDPDIITGYNVEGYDFPIIKERMRELGIEKIAIGRDLTGMRKRGERFWKANGRIVTDTWLAIKREIKPKKETLGYVAKTLIGEEKKEIDPLKIDEEWAKASEKVVDYCAQDAKLALKLFEEIKVVEKSMDLATVSKLPVGDVMDAGSSTLIDSILIRKADKHKVAVPCTSHGKGRRVVGGYVHEVTPGIYNWVCLVDFRAMYPSIIMENNICFTTLSDKGEIESPIGARFVGSDKKKGLLPRILKKLSQDRERAKMLMRESKDTKKIRYYDGLQRAIKILMNSFYGVFASAFYRFTNPEIGGSITAFARKNTKKMIKQLSQEGVKVVYSDTDSVFFQSPYPELKGSIEFGKKVAERFSKGYRVLELERIIEPFFSHGKKKRYVGKVVWPEESTLVRGYEIRRTDAFDLQSEALSHVFDKILANQTEEAVKCARKEVKNIKEGKAPVDKLVISRSCKPFSSYKDPERLANVQAAKKLLAQGRGFTPGMKVSWVVTDGKATPQKVEPWVDGVEFKHKPDYDYYAERVAASLARATEVFGVDERALLTGVRQRKLF